MLPEHIINKIMLYVSHPITDMYREYNDLFEHILNYKCCCEGHCKCDEWHLEFVSKAVLLYQIKDYRKETNHKLEKMLELKVVMNYLENQMGLYSYGKRLSNQDQRICIFNS
jgi:hypothetical protein